MIDDPIALVAVIVGITGFGFWLEVRFGWARQVGASLLSIFFGAVLANFDLVTHASRRRCSGRYWAVRTESRTRLRR